MNLVGLFEAILRFFAVFSKPVQICACAMRVATGRLCQRCRIASFTAIELRARGTGLYWFSKTSISLLRANCLIAGKDATRLRSASTDLCRFRKQHCRHATKFQSCKIVFFQINIYLILQYLIYYIIGTPFRHWFTLSKFN